MHIDWFIDLVLPFYPVSCLFIRLSGKSWCVLQVTLLLTSWQRRSIVQVSRLCVFAPRAVKPLSPASLSSRFIIRWAVVQMFPFLSYIDKREKSSGVYLVLKAKVLLAQVRVSKCRSAMYAWLHWSECISAMCVWIHSSEFIVQRTPESTWVSVLLVQCVSLSTWGSVFIVQCTSVSTWMCVWIHSTKCVYSAM